MSDWISSLVEAAHAKDARHQDGHDDNNLNLFCLECKKVVSKKGDPEHDRRHRRLRLRRASRKSAILQADLLGVVDLRGIQIYSFNCKNHIFVVPCPSKTGAQGDGRCMSCKRDMQNTRLAMNSLYCSLECKFRCIELRQAPPTYDSMITQALTVSDHNDQTSGDQHENNRTATGFEGLGEGASKEQSSEVVHERQQHSIVQLRLPLTPEDGSNAKRNNKRKREGPVMRPKKKIKKAGQRTPKRAMTERRRAPKRAAHKPMTERRRAEIMEKVKQMDDFTEEQEQSIIARFCAMLQSGM